MTRYLAWLAVLAVGCGHGAAVPVEPNPVRRGLEASLAAVDGNVPLDLRFNPGLCDCPAFELRLEERWIRADLQGDAERIGRWQAALARTPSENLPVPVSVLGLADRDLVRTAQGEYAVRVTVTEILQPPEPPPQPAPAADSP